MSGDIKGTPVPLNDYRDAVHAYPGMPDAEHRLAMHLAWKSSPTKSGAVTVQAVKTGPDELARELGWGRSKAAQTISNLVRNGWANRSSRGVLVLTVPPHAADPDLWIERSFERVQALAPHTEWTLSKQSAARKASKAKSLDRLRESPPPPDLKSAPSGLASPPPPDSEVRPLRTKETDIGPPGADYLGPAPYIGPVGALSPEPMPTGGTLPSVATPPGHPVPRPGGQELPVADLSGGGRDDLMPEQQPQDAHAWTPTRRAKLPFVVAQAERDAS